MDIPEKRFGRCELDSSGLGQESVADSWGHSTEHSGSIKGGNFFTSSTIVVSLRRALLYGVSSS
jgi:hypothetical protein